MGAGPPQPGEHEDLIRDAARIVDLEQLDHARFRSRFGERRHGDHLFGGQIIAQALAAAGMTVERRDCNSMHAYFLASGSASQPVTYDVERVREGTRFSIRRIVARQDDRELASIECSFHVGGEGLEHQPAKMPDVPPPECLPDLVILDSSDDGDGLAGEIENARHYPLMQIRLVDHENHRQPEPSGRRQFWVRMPTAASIEDSAAHQQLLCYMSDYMFAGVAKLPHPAEHRLPRLATLSLDHAMWFHRGHLCSDWALYDCMSPYAGEGRGMAQGRLLDRDGRLIATVMQEALFKSLVKR